MIVLYFEGEVLERSVHAYGANVKRESVCVIKKTVKPLPCT